MAVPGKAGIIKSTERTYVAENRLRKGGSYRLFDATDKVITSDNVDARSSVGKTQEKYNELEILNCFGQ